MSDSLVSDFIKKHIQKETELENIISDLRNEIKSLKESGNSLEYFLYKDILALIIPKLKFEYDSSGEGFYKVSMSPVSMTKTLIDELLKDIQKYKEQHKDEY